MMTQSELKQILQYDPNTGEFTWLVSRQRIRIGSLAGTMDDKGYIVITINGKKYLAHRLGWLYIHGSFPIDQLDHINGIRNDNSISNLREVTHQKNCFNMTEARGYTWDKRAKKWRAHIVLNGKKIHLGLFDNEADARNAYLTAKQKFHII